MTHDELIPFLLDKASLFESFGRDSIETIVEGSELRTFEGNESIIQCGDEGRFIGVLLDGHGEISVADNTGGRIVMSPLEVGDVFGEMSVLTGDRTVADVIAGNRCLVLLIPQDLVSSHILVNPKAILYLSKLLADRARAQRQADTLLAASTHWLRHTAASHQLDAGVPLLVVSQNLRHSTIQTTRKYLHTEDDARHQASQLHGLRRPE